MSFMRLFQLSTQFKLKLLEWRYVDFFKFAATRHWTVTKFVSLFTVWNFVQVSNNSVYVESFFNWFFLLVLLDLNVQVTTLLTSYSPWSTQAWSNHHKNPRNTQTTKTRHTKPHKHHSRIQFTHKCSSHHHTPINHKDKMSPFPPPITTNQVLAVCNIHLFTQVWVSMLVWTWRCTVIQMDQMFRCNAPKCNGHHKTQVRPWMCSIRRYWVPVLIQTVLHIPLRRIFGHNQQQQRVPIQM